MGFIEKTPGQRKSCLLRTGYSTGLGLVQIGWKTVPWCVAALARRERMGFDATYADGCPSSFGPGSAGAGKLVSDAV